MEFDEVLRVLDSINEAIPVGNLLPPHPLAAELNKPGLYSIFIDDRECLPPEFAEYMAIKSTSMVYLGKAEARRSPLYHRLVAQDLGGRGHSTFFRSMGAALGKEPLWESLVGNKNQNNYKFDRSNTECITKWMKAHLSVRWVRLRRELILEYERLAIDHFRPVLNIQHNPEKLAELERLRAKCRSIARAIPPPSGEAKRYRQT